VLRDKSNESYSRSLCVLCVPERSAYEVGSGVGVGSSVGAGVSLGEGSGIGVTEDSSVGVGPGVATSSSVGVGPGVATSSSVGVGPGMVEDSLVGAGASLVVGLPLPVPIRSSPVSGPLMTGESWFESDGAKTVFSGNSIGIKPGVVLSVGEFGVATFNAGRSEPGVPTF
jgi:hypothetical protein